MRAAIYCRISLDRTGEEMGVTRQLEDCRALTESLSWPVVATFADNDISATSGKLRPEYRKMLASIKRGEIDAVVAWHPDRLYRRLADLEELISSVDKNDVVIRTVRAGEFDLSTATGKMLARILASVSAGEGELKSERWRRSVRQRRESGHVPMSGPRLFGYEKDGEIHPTEARVVAWLAESVIEGESVNALATKLNEMGILTTLGNQWSRNTVKQMLSNARLAGHSLLNGDAVGRGQWEPILTEETFEQVQAALTVRHVTMRRPRVGLLVGLAFCSECGSVLRSGRRARRGAVEGQRVYKCRKSPGEPGCGGVTVIAEPVEEIAEAYARARLADPRVRERLNALAASTGDKTAEVIGLEQRLAELEAQLDEPGVPVATIMRAMDRTRERIETLRAEVALAPRPVPVKGDWPEDLGRRARLVQLAIEKVVVSPASRGGNTFDMSRVTIVPRVD